MDKKILVTGATGFVGRQIIINLLSRGDTVVLPVVRDSAALNIGKHKYLESALTTKDLFKEDENWWAKACNDTDVVIHTAWYTEPGFYQNSAKNLECLETTLKLARGAVKAGVKKVVGIGTCVEYDLSAGMLSVFTQLKPTSVYGGAKAAAYLSLSQYLASQDVDFAWCRLFYLYGEGEKENRLVPYLHKVLSKGEAAQLTSGSQIRDFMDVKVAAAQIVRVAIEDIQGPVNVCSGVPVTVRQLAESVADQYGKRKLLNFGVRPDNPVDPPCVVGISNIEQKPLMDKTQNPKYHDE